MRGNTELIFHHGIGGLLELGEEYKSHTPDSWSKACYTKQPFTAMVPTFPESKGVLLSEVNTTRERLVLTPRDVVLLNGSVHGLRKFNLRNIADLLDCKKIMKYKENTWPTLAYMMTGTQHFPTNTGMFQSSLLERNDDYGCRQNSEEHGDQDEELSMLKDRLPILGQEIIELEYEAGDLHVGGRDCLHWLQPGIPDLLAMDVVNFIA
jgi:hypothetical protein